MAKPNSHAPLGEGGRFAALKQKLSKRKGVSNPGALAAYIGRKKYGKAKFQKMAANGSGPFTEAEIKQGYKCEYDANDLAKMDEKQNANVRPKGAKAGRSY